MRFFLLLASTLGIRPGAIVRLSGSEYDAEKRTLRFVTKGQSKQTLPVTEEIADILATLDLDSPMPFM